MAGRGGEEEEEVEGEGEEETRGSGEIVVELGGDTERGGEEEEDPEPEEGREGNSLRSCIGGGGEGGAGRTTILLV